MKTSSKDFAYAMLPLKAFAWPMGIWPLQKYNFLSTVRTIITLAIVTTMLTVIQTEMYLDRSDPAKNLDALALSTCDILALWKVILFRLRSEGLISNFSSAVKDYEKLYGEEKRAIMRQHAYMGRVACAIVIGFSYFSSVLFMTVPMLSEKKPIPIEDVNATVDDRMDFPIPSKFAVATLHMPHQFYPVIFLIQLTMMLTASTGSFGSDSLFFGITFHLCGQAEVLKLEFNKFVDKGENMEERFNVLTTRHDYLLKLSGKLSDTISTILIVQLFTSCVLICTSGFQCILSLKVNNVVMVIKTLIVLGTLLTQLYAYSYVGEYLKNQMESIGFSAYCSSWYNIPKSLSRDIVFVLMRSQSPAQLKAGQFFIVNMETYMSIVKTSMSYLSLLRVMITI
ncbi:odorant receptor 9a-like [Ptiloglossa arizonensis]|uniref:odorant receptor 9a-like n=1 Tax=Ptiloglossa arizonensis TaxID=3350558 RepID=UPI003FA16E27